jgi:hypothetical protein
VRYDLPGFGSRSSAVAEALGTPLDSLADEAGDAQPDQPRRVVWGAAIALFPTVRESQRVKPEDLHRS